MHACLKSYSVLVHVQLCSRAIHLIFGLRFYLFLYFVLVSREGSWCVNRLALGIVGSICDEY